MYSRTTCEFGDKVFCSSCQRRVLVCFKSKDSATFLKNHKYQCTSYLLHRNQIYKAVNTKCNKRHQCLSVFCCTSYSLLCIFDFGAINKKYIEIDDCFFINVAGSLLFKDTRTRLWQLEQYTSSPSSQVVLENLEGAPFPFWFFPLILNQTKQFYHRRNFKGQPTLGIVSNRLQLMFFFYSQTVRTRLEIVYIPPSQVGRLCFPREPCKQTLGRRVNGNEQSVHRWFTSDIAELAT